MFSDQEINNRISKGEMTIEPFSDECLQPASYDMRIGKCALIAGEHREIDLEKERTFSLLPGAFAVITTLEKITLSNQIAGHIGMRSYFTRRGLIMLGGLQIDPGFDGHLLLGVYNASPKHISLDYNHTICTTDYYELSSPVSNPYGTFDAYKRGEIPQEIKDYLRTLDTPTLSQMSILVKELEHKYDKLSDITLKVMLPLWGIVMTVLLTLTVGILNGIWNIGG